MNAGYQVQIRVGRQEDGLWRVEVPDLHGCWVDAPTLAQALSEIQEVIAQVIDYSNEQGGRLPASVTPLTTEPVAAQLPVILSEHLRTPSIAQFTHTSSLPV